MKIILATLLAAQAFAAVAQSNAAAPLDYSTFSKFIADRNIFDPNRIPNRPFVSPTNKTTQIVRRANSFSLVGTMNYGEGDTAGTYAFFNGTSSQYSKAAGLNDTIAIFKVTAIGADSVTLISETNETVLKLGDLMRDDTEGKWHYMGQMALPSGGGFTSNRTSRNTGSFGNSREFSRDNQNGNNRRRNDDNGINGSNGNNGNTVTPFGNGIQSGLANQVLRFQRGDQGSQIGTGENNTVTERIIVLPEGFVLPTEGFQEGVVPNFTFPGVTPADE